MSLMEMISVDRSKFLGPREIEKDFPAFKEFLFPDLQQSGPDSFLVLDLEPCYFKGETSSDKIFSGIETLKRLQDWPEQLERTLNLQDGFALMNLPSETFIEEFPMNFVVCWKSAIRNIADNVLVPVIRAKGTSVFYYLHWVYDWKFPAPYYRFASE